MHFRSRTPSRRDVIRAGAVGAAALLIGRTTSAQADDLPTPTPECHETEDNLLGPYWRRSAPVRSDLTERGMAGTRLRVTGQVLGLASAACTPIPNALLDVWQADDRGRKPAVYSADGSWRLRGRLYTRADGSYDLRTIIPGHYGDGNDTRPAHIHVRVSAPGHRRLTTQLYFAGDPYNDQDPFIEKSLIMQLTDAPGGASGSDDDKAARFDFVLRPA